MATRPTLAPDVRSPPFTADSRAAIPSWCGLNQPLSKHEWRHADTAVCAEPDSAAGTNTVLLLLLLPSEPDYISCSMDWVPVCGENGETYTNDCVAAQAGQAVACMSECPCPPPPSPPPSPSGGLSALNSAVAAGQCVCGGEGVCNVIVDHIRRLARPQEHTQRVPRVWAWWCAGQAGVPVSTISLSSRPHVGLCLLCRFAAAL